MCIIKFFILKLLIYYSSKLIIKFIIHKNFIILILTNRLFKYFSQSPQFRSVFVFFFSLIIIFFKKFDHKNSLNISKSVKKSNQFLNRFPMMHDFFSLCRSFVHFSSRTIFIRYFPNY